MDNNVEISDAKSIASNYHIYFSNIGKELDNPKFLEKIVILWIICIVQLKIVSTFYLLPQAVKPRLK